MASNQTTNYGLNQWEATDQVLRTDFNADNSKIDAALKGLADKDTALEGTLASQAAAIGSLGNCGIEIKTYVGTGTYGSSNPTKITFSKPPEFFFVQGSSAIMLGSKRCTRGAIVRSASYGATVENPILTWSGNRVSFYNTSEAYAQMNHSGETYCVAAFYARDNE